jgi:hypothetical protein
LLAACAFSLPVTASDRLQALAIEAKAMLAEATQAGLRGPFPRLCRLVPGVMQGLPTVSADRVATLEEARDRLGH